MAHIYEFVEPQAERNASGNGFISWKSLEAAKIILTLSVPIIDAENWFRAELCHFNMQRQGFEAPSSVIKNWNSNEIFTVFV